MLHRNILSVSCSIISLNLKKRQKNLIKDPSPDIKHSRKNKGEGLMDSGHFASFTIDFGYIICLERSIPELLSLLPNVDCLITSPINLVLDLFVGAENLDGKTAQTALLWVKPAFHIHCFHVLTTNPEPTTSYPHLPDI
jgi:hypothetical protein